ncbi:MAG: SGNH/GDSL hydrolase family protein [Acutalibacteraceae bacterium]
MPAGRLHDRRSGRDSSAGSESLPAEALRRLHAPLCGAGDSIARGYGLDDPETQAYPALLRDRMQQCSEVEYANYAVDGQTSAGLLELLSSGGAADAGRRRRGDGLHRREQPARPDHRSALGAARRAGAGYAVAAAQVLRGDHRR